MSQIPETGPIVKISVSTWLFHPTQPRKGPQCSKFRNCPLTEANYKDPNIEHCQTSCGMYVGVFLYVRMCQWQVLWRTHYALSICKTCVLIPHAIHSCLLGGQHRCFLRSYLCHPFICFCLHTCRQPPPSARRIHPVPPVTDGWIVVQTSALSVLSWPSVIL